MLLLGCKRTKTESTIQSSITEQSTLNWDSKTSKPLSNLIDSIQIVPLETHSNGLFGGISKVIIKAGRIYIFDARKANALLVFDQNNGKFLFKVGSRGGGPGEYNLLKNFDVTDDKIYLLVSSQKKVITFNIEGKYLKEERISFTADDIVALKNGDFLFSKLYNIHDVARENGYRLKLTDGEFNIKQNLFKVNKNDSQLARESYFYNYGSDKVSYNAYIQDSVIIFDKLTGKYDTYFFDFGNKKIPIDKRLLAKDVLQSTNYCYLYLAPPFQINKYIIGTSVIGKSIEVFIFDTTNGQLYLNDSHFGSDDFSKYMAFPHAEDNNRVYSIINGGMYKVLVNGGFPTDSLISKHLEIEDNMAIIIYKLRT